MIELKQLHYLIACADTGTFSKAAEILFTSQSNVSKVIKSMEEELNCELFLRKSGGISLTEKGMKVYRQALRIIEQTERLEESARIDQREELHIASNPSAWMARVLRKYYELHEAQELHFYFMTMSSTEMIRHLNEGTEDLGFVYVTKAQLPMFSYRLHQSGLAFIELKETNMLLYMGKENKWGKIWGRFGTGEKIPLEEIRLVQSFEDEFSVNTYWHASDKEKQKKRLPVSVTTNSDYVMREMLAHTALCNVSGGYLTGQDEKDQSLGLPLSEKGESVVFGCILKKDRTPSKWAQDFLIYVKNQLSEEADNQE